MDAEVCGVHVDEKLLRSVRNIRGVSLVPSARLTAREVIGAARVVATADALIKLQEALAFLPARMPGLALDGDPALGSVHGIYGLDSLPIQWTSA